MAFPRSTSRLCTFSDLDFGSEVLARRHRIATHPRSTGHPSLRYRSTHFDAMRTANACLVSPFSGFPFVGSPIRHRVFSSSRPQVSACSMSHRTASVAAKTMLIPLHVSAHVFPKPALLAFPDPFGERLSRSFRCETFGAFFFSRSVSEVRSTMAVPLLLGRPFVAIVSVHGLPPAGGAVEEAAWNPINTPPTFSPIASSA